MKNKNKVRAISQKVFLSFALFWVYFGIIDMSVVTFGLLTLCFFVINQSYDLWQVRKTWLKISLNLLLGFVQGFLLLTLFFGPFLTSEYWWRYIPSQVMPILGMFVTGVNYVLFSIYDKIQRNARRKVRSSENPTVSHGYSQIQSVTRKVLQFGVIFVISLVIIFVETFWLGDLMYYDLMGSIVLVMAVTFLNIIIMRIVYWFYPTRKRKRSLLKKIFEYILLPSSLFIPPILSFMMVVPATLVIYVVIFSLIFLYIARNQKPSDSYQPNIDRGIVNGKNSAITKCPGCQMEIEGEILQVLEEKTFVFCKYCGRKLLKFELLKVDEKIVIEEHQKILEMIHPHDTQSRGSQI